jgi:hypothetical protein
MAQEMIDSIISTTTIEILSSQLVSKRHTIHTKVHGTCEELCQQCAWKGTIPQMGDQKK